MIDLTVDTVLIIILSFSVLSQAIFGVGVLLWGTPALLLYGLSFEETLSALLPISIVISALQFLPHFKLVNKLNYKKFYFYSAPFLLIGLSTVLTTDRNVNLFVFIALIISGLLRLNALHKMLKIIEQKRDYLLPLIGYVHGISNLGGGLLVVWASMTEKSKLPHRTTVAFIYLNLACLQLVTLYLLHGYIPILLTAVLFSISFYLTISRYIFVLIDNFVFDKLLTILIFSTAAIIGLTKL